MQPHYRDPLPLGDPDGLPYSKGMMARALVSAGVSIEAAYEIATRLELDLIASGAPAVEQEGLDETAAEVLGESDGARIVLRMQRLAALKALDIPIVLLVGGATGTGKSTVATEAAHRLGITRVTSTDFIRQTIRAYFPPAQMPSVHVSSFEAGRLGRSDRGRVPSSRPNGCSWASRPRSSGRSTRAGRWRSKASTWCPGMVPAEIEGALLVHAVLHVESLDEHRSHFVLRDSSTGGRAPAREVHQGPRGDPGSPGRHRRPCCPARRPGDRELEHRPRNHLPARPRPEPGRRPRGDRVGQHGCGRQPRTLRRRAKLD